MLGDFNAHLKYTDHTGEIAGINPPGLCLEKFIDNLDLYPVSLTSLCTGPAYTYHSGDQFTTIDYVLAGSTFAPYISLCEILELHLDEYYHLPISLEVYKVDPVYQVESIYLTCLIILPWQDLFSGGMMWMNLIF